MDKEKKVVRPWQVKAAQKRLAKFIAGAETEEERERNRKVVREVLRRMQEQERD